MKTPATFLLLFFALQINFAQSPLEKVDFYSVDDLNIDETFQNPDFQAYYNKDYDTQAFLDKYFYPWNVNQKETANAIKASKSFGAFFSYNKKLKDCQTGNYHACDSDFIQKLLANTTESSFPNTSEYGMVLSRTDVRQLPTKEYCWKRSRSAGEGYPFDYFQETSLWIATPVLVLHRSEDALWYFIESAYSKGWVEAKTIGFISKKQRKDLMKRKYAAILKDDLVVQTNTHPKQLRVGTLLPIESQGKLTKVSLPIASAKHTKFESVSLEKENAASIPLTFNAKNMKQLLPELLGGKYSWGGIDGGRDCSSTIKDLMTPFGIWLPRNSVQQRKTGKVAKVEGTKTEKFETIIKEGIPFLSIIYKRGHAMLYVGQNEQNEPLIFHNVWGLKPIFSDTKLLEVARDRDQYGLLGVSGADFYTTEVSARYIIGQAVITTSDPEQHFPKSDKLKFQYFMGRIESINCIVGKQ